MIVIGKYYFLLECNLKCNRCTLNLPPLVAEIQKERYNSVDETIMRYTATGAATDNATINATITLL